MAYVFMPGSRAYYKFLPRVFEKGAMRMIRIRKVSLTAVAVVGLLGPFAGSAAAALPLNQACSSGPATGPNGVNSKQYGCTTRVSMGPGNAEPDGTSQRPRISEDGNWVVFQSGADNLATDYQAGHGTDTYIVNNLDPAGTIEMLDRAAGGGMPNSAATFVDVTGSGEYAVFYSKATNLVAGRTTRAGSIFLRDVVRNRTLEVSISSTGGNTNGYSNRPTISGYPVNGKFYVAYNSKGTNLVAGATGADDVYVTEFDPTNFSVSRPKIVSHSLSGGGSNGQNEHAEISSDGRYIAWQSQATNLSSGDGDTIADIYESANPFLTTGAKPELVSVSSGGAKGRSPSTRPAVNGNGDEVGFESTATNLVAGDTNAMQDTFVRGTRVGAFVGNGTTIRVSVDYNGNQLTGNSQRVNLNGRGDKVGFAANGRTVVKGDLNGQRDVFLRDLGTGVNYLIDVCKTGGFGGGNTPCTGTAAASTSPDLVAPMARAGAEDLSSRSFLDYAGNSVAFLSGMSDLVPNDTNSAVALDDIFVRDFAF
jgi:hypothetical protein